MPDLFPSTTGDTKYNLFFGPREQLLFNDYNTEMLEMVAMQFLLYWPVEVDESDVNDIYGEAEKKVPRNPIKIYAHIMLEEPELTTGQFGMDRGRRIEVYAHRDRLTEVGIFPRVGDYLEWDNSFFEISYADVPIFVMGQPATKIGVTMRAIQVREGVFNPRMQDNESDTIQADSGNPY